MQFKLGDRVYARFYSFASKRIIRRGPGGIIAITQDAGGEGIHWATMTFDDEIEGLDLQGDLSPGWATSSFSHLELVVGLK